MIVKRKLFARGTKEAGKIAKEFLSKKGNKVANRAAKKTAEDSLGYMMKDAVRSARRMPKLSEPAIMRSIHNKGRLNTAGDTIINKNIIKSKHNLIDPHGLFKPELIK